MPLFWLCLSFLLGILVASGLILNLDLWAILAGICLLFALVAYLIRPRLLVWRPHWVASLQRLPPLPYYLLPLFLTLGGIRYSLSQPNLEANDFIVSYNDLGQEAWIEGSLIEPPNQRDTYTLLKVSATAIQHVEDSAWHPIHGLLLVRVNQYVDARYADHALILGELESPPELEDFSYRDYLARQNVYSFLSNPSELELTPGKGNPFWMAIYSFKHKAQRVVSQLWTEPESSLFAGILLGVETGISKETLKAFQDTGTAHIIAISGFNIAIISGLMVTLFSRWLGRFRGAVVAFFGIAFYTVFVGAGASVMRAALMGGLTLLAYQLGRRQVGVLSLIFVATLMAIINPMVLWDVGFQLSFAATLGLVLYAGPFVEGFIHYSAQILPRDLAQQLSRPVGEYFLFTIAAQILVLPIIAYHFERISLISMLANPLILPAQPPLMVLGGLATILGLVYLPLGKLVGWFAWPFALYTIRITEWMASFRGGAFSIGKVSLVSILIIFTAVLLVTLTRSHLNRYAHLVKPGVILTGLSLITIIVWRNIFAAPDGKLHITLIETGDAGLSGEALLIRTPGGGNILVDGGVSQNRLSAELGRRMPPFSRQIDYLIVANNNEEQVKALPGLIERFPPENVIWCGQAESSYSSRQLYSALIEAQIPILNFETGQVLDLGEGAKLSMQWVNPRGCVLLIEWQNFRALLPLAVDFDFLESDYLMTQISRLTVLLLADHGYTPSNPLEWIRALQPRLILLGVASDDRKGLPSTEVEEFLKSYPHLRTDRNGWIEINTDGEQMWLEVEKK